MNDFIAKPIEPASLWRVLRCFLVATAGESAGHREVPALEASAPVAPDNEQATLLRLQAIASLDMAGGLRRAVDRPQRYIATLREFVAGQGDAAAQLAEAMHAGDWLRAERVAHTLKGLAAHIGEIGRASCRERV